MCSVGCPFVFKFSSILFAATCHGARGLPIEEESGGSGCECDRGREGEAAEEQESIVPGTKEKGNRRGLAALLRLLSSTGVTGA